MECLGPSSAYLPQFMLFALDLCGSSHCRQRVLKVKHWSGACYVDGGW